MISVSRKNCRERTARVDYSVRLKIIFSRVRGERALKSSLNHTQAPRCCCCCCCVLPWLRPACLLLPPPPLPPAPPCTGFRARHASAPALLPPPIRTGLRAITVSVVRCYWRCTHPLRAACAAPVKLGHRTSPVRPHRANYTNAPLTVLAGPLTGIARISGCGGSRGEIDALPTWFLLRTPKGVLRRGAKKVFRELHSQADSLLPLSSCSLADQQIRHRALP